MPEEPLYTGTNTDFYVATPDVAETVNLAVHLGRPILVEGEPGCGKTRLADSIASEKNLGEPVRISVKSTTRAQDLLYRLNAIRRLQEAQNPNFENARYTWPYISLGPLGQAIHDGVRRVVLIDEVDKADIDFPNDLLEVLDRFEFQIEDLPVEEEELSFLHKGWRRTVRGNAARPIVVITSNREKRLPEPFLRRCLYIRLKFPDNAEVLRDIIEKNTRRPVAQWNRDILTKAVESFLAVRKLALDGNAQKPPTTSELIDWVQILYWKNVTPEELASTPLKPPAWETLFKTLSDLELYPALADAQAKRHNDV